MAIIDLTDDGSASAGYFFSYLGIAIAVVFSSLFKQILELLMVQQKQEWEYEVWEY